MWEGSSGANPLPPIPIQGRLMPGNGTDLLSPCYPTVTRRLSRLRATRWVRGAGPSRVTPRDPDPHCVPYTRGCVARVAIAENDVPQRSFSSRVARLARRARWHSGCNENVTDTGMQALWPARPFGAEALQGKRGSRPKVARAWVSTSIDARRPPAVGSGFDDARARTVGLGIARGARTPGVPLKRIRRLKLRGVRVTQVRRSGVVW